jgi:hypothetical protein
MGPVARLAAGVPVSPIIYLVGEAITVAKTSTERGFVPKLWAG